MASEEIPLDELPVCVTCGCSIKDEVKRIWHPVSTGQVATHMYYSACIQELSKRVAVLEGIDVQAEHGIVLPNKPHGDWEE